MRSLLREPTLLIDRSSTQRPRGPGQVEPRARLVRGRLRAVLVIAWVWGLWIAPTATLLMRGEPAYADEEWRQLPDDEDIQRWERDTALGPVYRASAVVRASREHISAVTRDFDRHHEWMSGCSQSRLLRYPSVLASVGYHRMTLPIPFVSDRDITIYGSGAFDPNADRIVIDFEAIEDPRMPRVEGVVRITRLMGRYVLTDLGDGRTQVEYELAADAGGWLPRALVHFYFRTLPAETLRGLRAQVEKGGYDDVMQVMRAGLELTWQGEVMVSGIGAVGAALPRSRR